jgi:hypothetical protein
MPWSPQAFPRMAPGAFVVTRPRTDGYNCVAGAADDDARWWWPVPETAYWPEGAPREVTVDAFVAAFATLGYARCDGGELEAGLEKVAIYLDRDDKPSHVARQMEDGAWSSKLGPEEHITHDLHGVEGPAYGTIAVFLARPRPA